jgi:hypothetical protein
MIEPKQRSWFWRNIGFRFTRATSGKLGPAEWSKVLKSTHRGKSRRSRRIQILIWIALIAFDIKLSLHITANLYMIGGRIATLANLLTLLELLLPIWFGFRIMRTSLSETSPEDRALIEHGTQFLALHENQRGEIMQKLVRERIFGQSRPDESERERQHYAEAVAYRFLRYGLPITVAIYAAFCHFGYHPPTRGFLMQTADGLLWLVIVILVLPTMIRMWTDPDQPGEPEILHGGPEIA